MERRHFHDAAAGIGDVLVKQRLVALEQIAPGVVADTAPEADVLRYEDEADGRKLRTAAVDVTATGYRLS